MPWGRYHSRRLLRRGSILLLATGIAGCASPPPDPDSGVSWTLAQQRAERIRGVRYQLSLKIPAERRQPILGRQIISFDYLPSPSGDQRLVIDFEPGAESVESITVNGRPAPIVSANGHLLLPEDRLPSTRVEVAIEFRAGDSSLNRRDDYLYTLFVPDRASEAIPCFDQPDLKASFELELEIPAAWTALSNGNATRDEITGSSRHLAFAATRPISTYLFAFAAGVFQAEAGNYGGRNLRFLHRETDQKKLERNRQALFDLHGQALQWLEEYSGVPFPFQKFEFVLLPAFQFGGMEHPGSVFYRAERLLLDESPTQNEILGRASLIAHETAHMWFGDLVTMAWFDDVWTKEVFANFMASKIIGPQFPEVNHDLRFFLGHYPAAYEVDRTAGTHPIRQQLDNLNDAASLYGAIIYEKAPIVMRQLELLIGDQAMQLGLREYLKAFAFGNARWPDLIEILDRQTDLDLEEWSRIWVESAGRPKIELLRDESNDGRQFVRLVQVDTAGQGRLWPQPINSLFWSQRGVRRVRLTMTGSDLMLGWVTRVPSVILPSAGGVAYGLFELPEEELRRMLESVAEFPEALDRAVAWETAWDALLENRLPAEDLLESLLRNLPREEEELVASRVLRLLAETYWGFLTPDQRLRRAPEVERVLWEGLQSAPSDSMRLNFFRALRVMALTPSGVSRVLAIWDGSRTIGGLKLSPSDLMETALQLAVRRESEAEQIIQQQLLRLDQPLLKEQLAFVAEAVSPDPTKRQSFFESLRQLDRRQREPWVEQALGYLHHPLRAQQSEILILPGLQLLQEIQRTGDIFFPKRWLDAILAGHQSPGAAGIVREFLANHPDYPPRLKAKILQSADILFRRAQAAPAS